MDSKRFPESRAWASVSEHDLDFCVLGKTLLPLRPPDLPHSNIARTSISPFVFFRQRLSAAGARRWYYGSKETNPTTLVPLEITLYVKRRKNAASNIPWLIRKYSHDESAETRDRARENCISEYSMWRQGRRGFCRSWENSRIKASEPGQY